MARRPVDVKAARRSKFFISTVLVKDSGFE
jgi:hypothetical protein